MNTNLNISKNQDHRAEFRTRADGRVFVTNPPPRLKNAEVAAPFRQSRRDEVKQARRGLKPDGPHTQLLAAIRKRKATPALYSLTTRDLGLGDRYADGVNVFDKDMVNDIKNAVRRTFGGLHVFYAVEVGDNGHTNVHVVGGLWDVLPDLQRGKKDDGVPVEAITPGTEEDVLRYLYKALPQTPRLMAAHNQLVQEGEAAPNRHGYLNRPRPPVKFTYKTYLRRLRRGCKKLVRDESESSLSVRLMGTTDERRRALKERYAPKPLPPLKVELPVILKGQDSEAVQVERLFKLYRQRHLNRVSLVLPDGTPTHDLEAAVAPEFAVWFFLPSRVRYLAEIMRTLENTLQGRKTRYWKPTAPPVSRRKSHRYRYKHERKPRFKGDDVT